MAKGFSGFFKPSTPQIETSMQKKWFNPTTWFTDREPARSIGSIQPGGKDGSTFLLAAQKAPGRSANEVDKAYRTSPWVHAAVRTIAFGAAETEWKAYNSAGEEVSSGHPMLDMLRRGNPYLDGFACMMITQIFMELRGECAWLLDRKTPGGEPIAYYPLTSRWFKRYPSPGDPYYTVMIGNKEAKIPAEDVVWFRYPSAEDPYSQGVGTAETLADELDVDELAAKMIKQRFLNGGRPDLIVTMQDAGDDVLEAAKARYYDEQRGPIRRGLPLFVNNQIDVREISTSFAELQLSELRSWERDTIISVFGIPPEILGVLSNSNRATITEATIIFRDRVMRSRLVLLQNFLARVQLQFKGPAGVEIRFVLQNISDPEKQQSSKLAAPWALTRGEWRVAMGLEDRGEIDNVHYVPMGFVLIRPEETAAPMASLPSSGFDAQAPVGAVEDLGEGEVIEEDEEPAAPRYAPQRSLERSFTKTEIKILLNALPSGKLEKRMSGIVQATGNKNAEKVAQKIGIEFGQVSNEVEQSVRGILKKGLSDVNKTTKAQLRKTLEDGILSGEGVAELKRRVRDVFATASSGRAEVIARTEAMKASNGARQIAMETAAKKGLADGLEKEWIAQLDDVTRDDHRLLDGARVGVLEDFVGPTSGTRAKAPGQSGDASFDVNCRCTCGPVFAERSLASSEPNSSSVEPIERTEPNGHDIRRASWGEFDSMLRSAEEDLTTAVRFGFKDQEREVLRVFDRLAV